VTAPENPTSNVEQAIREVLEQHRAINVRQRPANRHGIVVSDRVCVCGHLLPWQPNQATLAHRAHVAEQVAAVVAGVLRDAAEALPAATEGPLRVGTALWPECDRDAYSLAIEEAQRALIERADRETP
jgi:hypothetical protein